MTAPDVQHILGIIRYLIPMARTHTHSNTHTYTHTTQTLLQMRNLMELGTQTALDKFHYLIWRQEVPHKCVGKIQLHQK